jgi:hypothetical protein
VAGDYNRDAQVDGDDVLVWQRLLGSRTPALLNADGNGNRVIDAGDLGIWRGEFGEPALAMAFVAETNDSRGGDRITASRAIDAVFSSGDFTSLFELSLAGRDPTPRRFRPGRRL